MHDAHTGVRLGQVRVAGTQQESLALSPGSLSRRVDIYYLSPRGTVIKHTNSFALERKLVCNSILTLPSPPRATPFLLSSHRPLSSARSSFPGILGSI